MGINSEIDAPLADPETVLPTTSRSASELEVWLRPAGVTDVSE